jgi:hypothetical protein
VEELLEVHAGAERVARAGDHQHCRGMVVAQVLQHLRHVAVQLRVHGVLLVRAVEDDLGDLVPDLDLHCFVVHHVSFLTPRVAFRQ